MKLQPTVPLSILAENIHQHEEQIYSCNLEIEDTNQIIQDILAQNDKTEIIVAAGRQVFWNSKHISESEKLYKAMGLYQNLPNFTISALKREGCTRLGVDFV